MFKFVGAAIGFMVSFSKAVNIASMIVSGINGLIAEYKLRKILRKKKEIQGAETPADFTNIANKL